MTHVSLYCGELWHTPPPLHGAPRLETWTDGAMAVDELGRILETGSRKDLAPRYPSATTIDYGSRLILPGFVDAHAHFPQMDMIGAHGAGLLGWLERHTYPAEARYASKAIAEAAAPRFVTELLANGTTLACVYASSHAVSAHALLAECERRGLRAIVGKVSMDRDAPNALLQSPEDDARDNEELIRTWHGRDARLFVALTPRFALSCTEPMMQSLGELKRKHPSVWIQTHYAESQEELAEVARRFPHDKDYLAVYERFGLIGARTVLGHGIHVSDSELTRLAAARAAIAHCPSSNLFLGSGRFPLARMRKAGMRIGLGTDVGAGTSFSLLRTMSDGYKVQRLANESVAPAELLYLATAGGAEALGFGSETGDFSKGKAADFQVLDLTRSRLLRETQAKSPDDRLAALTTLGDCRLTHAVFVRGRKVYEA